MAFNDKEKNMKPVITLLTIYFLVSSSLYACWGKLPSLKTVVAESKLIVIGTIGKSKETNGPLKIANIHILQILKNQLTDQKLSINDKIPLSMPSLRTPKSIEYKKGTTGIWLLKYKEGKFWASNPMSLQKKDKVENIKGIIAGEKKQK